MDSDVTIRQVETFASETEALLECLKLYAPGVNWTVSLAARFRGSLLKRGYKIEWAAKKL